MGRKPYPSSSGESDRLDARQLSADPDVARRKVLEVDDLHIFELGEGEILFDDVVAVLPGRIGRIEDGYFLPTLGVEEADPGERQVLGRDRGREGVAPR